MVVVVCIVLLQKLWLAKYSVTWNTWGDRQTGICLYLVMGISWSRDPQGFQHLALLGQPLLFNHLEDCKYVYEVFLVVPTGVNGHAEVGRIRKLDLEDLRIFLGRDDVFHGGVRNGRPVRQLPLLALSVLQPVWGLEGGTHFGVMPESGTQQEFLKRRLRRNS